MTKIFASEEILDEANDITSVTAARRPLRFPGEPHLRYFQNFG